MENVIGDNEKKLFKDMSTQTEVKVETEKKGVEVETQTDLSDTAGGVGGGGGGGDRTPFKISKTVSKLFHCTKTNSIESIHTTSPKNLNDLEMSVRKPLLDKIDGKVDSNDSSDHEGVQNKVFEEEQNVADKAANANSVHKVEVTADLHHK